MCRQVSNKNGLFCEAAELTMTPSDNELRVSRIAVWKSGIWPKEGCASKVEDRTSRLMLVCSSLFLGLCIRISALALKGEIRPCSNAQPSARTEITKETFSSELCDKPN